MDIENAANDLPQEHPNKAPNKKKLPLLTSKPPLTKANDASLPLFEGLVFVFIPYGVQLTKKRVEILKSSCIKHKAEVIDLVFFAWEVPPGKRVFVIISEKMKWDYLKQQVHPAYPKKFPNFVYVDCEWISTCLQKKQYLDPAPFIVLHPSQQQTPTTRHDQTETEPLPQEPMELIHEDDNGSDMEYRDSEGGVSPNQLSEYSSHHSSQKLCELMKASSYPEPEFLCVKEETSAPAIREEETKNGKMSYGNDDEDVVFFDSKAKDPSKQCADDPQLRSIKKEITKNEHGIKSEAPAWYDPTFFGDEDVYITKVMDVKKEFHSEKDLEGTIIEGITDFNHVNKNLEGNLNEVKEFKLLKLGKNNRNLLPNLTKDQFHCITGYNKANPNALIISELENVLKTYKNVKDTGRIIGYNKAIAAIRCFPRKIETEEDLNQISGVGQKTKKKIMEILKTGKLRQARLVESDDQHKTLTLFTSIWGVGLRIAEQWYSMGFRTIEDLRKHPEVLNRHQTLGVKYFEEFLKRIPRAEVEEIVKYVRQKADELSDVKGVYEVVACGSYRRGKPTSGDADLLMTRKDGGPYKGFLEKLVKSMEGDFITDHLKIPSARPHGCETYMGWCMFKEVGLHRRLDIKIYPKDHFAFAVLYFTGSQNFNKSMRLFAWNKGYSLSDHGLIPVNRVKNAIVWRGKTVKCDTEEDVFKFLGLEYKPPEDRDLA